MADLSITAPNVIATGTIESATAGETITAGQVVRRDATASNKLKKALNTSAANAAAWGIALNGASNDQPADVLTRGNLDVGSGVAVGAVYVVSAASGAIAPATDLLSGEFVTVLGIGISASVIAVDIQRSGIAKA